MLFAELSDMNSSMGAALGDSQKSKLAMARPSNVGNQEYKTRKMSSFSLLRSMVWTVALFLASVYIFLPGASRLETTTSILSRALQTSSNASTPPLLPVFQVYPPVFTPDSDPAASSSGCNVSVTLMDYVFAYSYGHPFIGFYKPPDCNFNRVVFNLSIVSAGRQFDRLAIVYLGNTEVWRLSTAEPTQTGIEFGYIKDMSNYLALLKKPQKLIFDLGNLIDSTYTGSYNATLVAQFFTSEDTIVPADRIIPVSARLAAKNMSSVFSIPSQNASNTLTLPRNIDRAVFSISSCGQIDEEFWFGNVQQSQVQTFESNPEIGTLLGYSPFREVQLFIDGQLAGVAWPFPIIFTGGVVPGLWRPIVGINAFDLKEDEIDITAWLPLLCDGASHTFEIRVAGITDQSGEGQLTETVGSYWLVTGKLFLWQGPSNFVTTGSKPSIQAPQPKILLGANLSTNSTGANRTLTYDTFVTRKLDISATVNTSEGQKSAFWSQDLSYSNHGRFSKFGNVQLIIQNTTGYDDALGYSRHYNYPIRVTTGFFADLNSGNFTLDANITRGLDLQIFGQAVFPTGVQSFEALPAVRNGYPSFQGSSLYTTQNGTGHYFAAPSDNIATGSGTTQQDMVFVGIIASQPQTGKPQIKGSRELYERHVLAVNGTVVRDSQTLIGQPYRAPSPSATPLQQEHGFAGMSVLRTIGRGPGKGASPP